MTVLRLINDASKTWLGGRVTPDHQKHLKEPRGNAVHNVIDGSTPLGGPFLEI